jgi:methionyl aminopeptidase
MVTLKSPAELEQMRRGGRILAEVLRGLRDLIRPGATTAELDGWAEKLIRRRGGVPAFKGYRGFPATLCTSPNETVVHGIPGPRVLRDGDLLSVDVGVKVGEWYSDAAWTYPVGQVTAEAQRLMRVTQEALELAVAEAQPGKRISDLGHAVQEHVEAVGFSVVRDYVGHGIGRELHEEPQIPNFGPPNQGLRLQPGMTLAIEPMVNAGGYAVKLLEDHWTVITADGSLSAHFEHTVLVREGSAEVLTL